jgi:SAM-dependent methyltransferase
MRTFCSVIFVALGFANVYANDLTDVFEKIYQNGNWDKDQNNRGTSGLGSHVVNVKPYFYFLENFLIQNRIKTIVDAGCGDWQFSKYLNLEGIKYLGVDASSFVISNNLKNFAKENVEFIHGNFLDMELPKADLLILKDVLQHLSHKNIQRAIEKFDNFKYVLVTNDISTPEYTNYDINDGEYRCLDLSIAPYFLKGKNVLIYKAVCGSEVKQVFLITNP